LAIAVGDTHSIVHQPASGDILAPFIDRRDGVASRQGDDPIAPAVEEDVCRHHKRTNPPYFHIRECCFHIVVVGGLDDLQFHASGARGRLPIRHFGRRAGKIRIDQYSNHGCVGNEFAQQFDSIRHECLRKKGHTGDIATRPVETGDEAVPDEIGRGKNNWNRRACSLGRQCGRRAAGEDRGDMITDQISRKRRQAIILTIR